MRGSLDLPSPPSTKNDYEREREATDPPELDWSVVTLLPGQAMGNQQLS